MSAAFDARPVLEPERPDDATAALALVDRCFGPGRFAKAAERLREGNHPYTALSFVVRDGGEVVASVRLWPVRIGERPALLLGPIAVDPRLRHQGLGHALVEQACAAAEADGHALVVLVGDASFFGRLGFEVLPTGRIRMPGPADPGRVLVKALRPGTLDGLEGEVALPAASARR